MRALPETQSEQANDKASSKVSRRSRIVSTLRAPEPLPNKKAPAKRRLPQIDYGKLAIVSVCLLIGLAFSIANELKSSTLQSLVFSSIAKGLTSSVQNSESKRIHFPTYGPHDIRAGYVSIPQSLQALQARSYSIDSQARLSLAHKQFVDMGVYPIYDVKAQTGIKIVDESDAEIYSYQYPARVFTSFEDIPSVITKTLLFIEDRSVLNDESPQLNPAIEWGRFSTAVLGLLRRLVDEDHKHHGGSTLATQAEKFRHSPNGLTGSPKEKLRQMATAALRAYSGGTSTLETRKQIVLDYVNSVPLAARSEFGEVNGVGDGLWAYYGSDLAKVSANLHSASTTLNPIGLLRQGKHFNEVLNLFLAHRRPAFYLAGDITALNKQRKRYLPLLYKSNVIPLSLFWSTLQSGPYVLISAPENKKEPSKGVQNIRSQTLTTLGMKSLYELDRYDLKVRSTIASKTQAAVEAKLEQLSDPEFLKDNKLIGYRLIKNSNIPEKITYSFSLYELAGSESKLRVQTDSFPGPFNINEGIKLDLGSTAKLRTLISYLQIVESLYKEILPLSLAERNRMKRSNISNLRTWALNWINRNPGAPLMSILCAALDKQYSASPKEAFFTGGGLHRFVNFNHKHNTKDFSIREAVQSSINLPFVRLMRDLVDHYTHDTYGFGLEEMELAPEPLRESALKKFTQDEGRLFLRRFAKAYEDRTEDGILKTFRDRTKTAGRMSVLLANHAENQDEFRSRITEHFPKLRDKPFYVNKMYKRYSTLNEVELNERAARANVHPLELWLVERLLQDPNEPIHRLMKESKEVSIQSYDWLFKNDKRSAQNQRIRTVIEAEAFRKLHKTWRELGYAYSSIIPSLATTLGSSADTPASLSSLMGILLAGGQKTGVKKFLNFEFAKDTPYETNLSRKPAPAKQVISAEISTVVLDVLREVVSDGTAARIKRRPEQWKSIYIGGKTGTGDHRDKLTNSRGKVYGSVVRNRTATFVFYLGERHYGTISAIVTGPEAADYRFTSSLPVAVLKLLLPDLEELVLD